ncbi:MAG: alpha/beta hydrolase [Siphonobacter sp.]
MKLAYHIFGAGPLSLLAFHGVGQTGYAYESWGTELGHIFTIYAFDLPFHGDNPSIHRPVLTKAEWKSFLEVFLRERAINQFRVAGFSMGGRFALASLEAFPERILQAYLLAPDGLVENRYYRFAVGSSITRQLLKFFVKHPSLVETLANILKKAGFIHPSTVRFVNWMLNSPEKQLQVYESWITFRKLRFSPQKLADILNQHHIPVECLMGEFDRLMPPGQALILTSKTPHAFRTILPCGHHRLIEQAAKHKKVSNDWLET